MKVMIVDDDEDIRIVCELAVRKVGKWDVVMAASGREALDLARSELPDVILLDVMMPGMDGPQTLEGLRNQSQTAKIPVIFLTAKAQQREIDRYMALGANGVIRKPFDVMKLTDEIRRIVEAS
jgi:CheY-like chemotaxis protein